MEYLISQYLFREKADATARECPSIKKIIWTCTPSDETRDLKATELNYEELIDRIKGGPFKEPDPTHDDISQLYDTSGTTGRPKGVVMTHMMAAPSHVRRTAQMTL